MASDFEIFRCYEQAWEIYKKINPDREASGKKGFELECKKGADPKQILDSVKIYYYESLGTDPQYRYQFGNFVREGYWQDYVDKFSSTADYLARVKAQAEAAEELINTWNQERLSHWNPVLDVHTKVGLAKRALQDEAFEKNWKKSLDLAKDIFYKPLHSSDHRSKINISFQWFTTLGEKNTVMRLLEGFFGKPEKDIFFKPRPKEVSKEEEEEAIKESAALWEEVFGPSQKRKERDHPEDPQDPIISFLD